MSKNQVDKYGFVFLFFWVHPLFRVFTPRLGDLKGDHKVGMTLKNWV
jgi:hypothetical protein